MNLQSESFEIRVIASAISFSFYIHSNTLLKSPGFIQTPDPVCEEKRRVDVCLLRFHPFIEIVFMSIQFTEIHISYVSEE